MLHPAKQPKNTQFREDLLIVTIGIAMILFAVFDMLGRPA